MNPILAFVDIILHLDLYLGYIIDQFGVWAYLVLFAIIFCETGLVITPFLPGDSLIFVAGVFAASGSFNLGLVFLTLAGAAILGDSVNYFLGHHFGKRVLKQEKIKFIKKEHIAETQDFYKKHGSKTVILARFLPILRTFAPFVAGIAQMPYLIFLTYSVLGAIVWVGLFVLIGYFFGNIPLVKENFSIAVMIIVVASLIPPFVEYLKHRRCK